MACHQDNLPAWNVVASLKGNFAHILSALTKQFVGAPVPWFPNHGGHHASNHRVAAAHGEGVFARIPARKCRRPFRMEEVGRARVLQPILVLRHINRYFAGCYRSTVNFRAIITANSHC